MDMSVSKLESIFNRDFNARTQRQGVRYRYEKKNFDFSL